MPCIKTWMPGIKPGMTGHDERPRRPIISHRGRKFRGKRLKTTLPRPAAEAPLPEAKSAERIAKVMARAGLCSRREAEAWIAAGRVAVNGATITSPALNVTARDRITRRRQAVAAARAHAAVPVPQAARPRHHQRRHPRPADHLRRAAEGHAAGGQRRPARSQHRGPAAAHQRRRAGARARTAGDRLAAALPRARLRQDHAGAARRAAPRHRGRRHPLRRDRGDARPRAGRQRLARPLPCARARTAKSATCSARSACR